jgi:hypothetical protein
MTAGHTPGLRTLCWFRDHQSPLPPGWSAANAATSSVPADNSGRRDQEAVTEDRAAANLARVTGRLDTDAPHMDRPPRTGRLVPVTGHSQGQLAVPPNRTQPSITEHPVQPAGSAGDAHIMQRREPQPGMLGNMNWRQNNKADIACEALRNMNYRT